MTIILIASLMAVGMAGLGYALCQALQSGAARYAGSYAEDTARDFEDIFLFIPPRRIAEAGWAAAGATFLITFFLLVDMASARGILVAALLAGLAAGLALFAPRKLVAVLKARRRQRFNAQLVDTLVNMSNAMKAGFSITQTFETVVQEGENPIAQEFGVFLHQIRVGVNFSDALDKLDQRVGSEDLTLVILAIETARKTGGNLTEMFEKIAATIRERMRIENRVRTLTAQGRLQGTVVAAMPVVIAVALIVVDPLLMLPFLRSPAGAIVVVIVAALIACGALIIRKIVNIDV